MSSETIDLLGMLTFAITVAMGEKERAHVERTLTLFAHSPSVQPSMPAKTARHILQLVTAVRGADQEHLRAAAEKPPEH